MDSSVIRRCTLVRVLVRGLESALLAPVLLLAACGSGNDSVADPPISASPSSSSPTQPAHRESPEHFIRRWAKTEKRMENTGDTGPYLALSRGCEPCMKLATRVDSYYKAGGYVRWGGWHILSIRKYSSSHRPQFTVHSRSTPTEYKSSSNSATRHFSGGSITYIVKLKQKTDGSWVLTNKSELES